MKFGQTIWLLHSQHHKYKTLTLISPPIVVLKELNFQNVLLTFQAFMLFIWNFDQKQGDYVTLIGPT